MQNWIVTTFNVSEGLAQGLALAVSLSVVLILFGLFVFVIKRLMNGNTPQVRGRQPRIALMDSASIDGRRRLLLVRRDNVEHLILVGGPSDVVVEQNIIKNAPLAGTIGRSGPYATATPAAGGLKAPIAPGPEIPLSPEVAAPVAEALNAPTGKTPETAPVAPVPASLPNGPSATSPAIVADRTKASEPIGAGSAPKTAPAGRPPQPSAPPPASGAPNSAAAGNRLLEAAERNGFTRGKTQKTAPSTYPASAQDTPGSIDANTQAEQKTASTGSTVSDIAAPAPEKRGSRSLLGAFSRKDRPSYAAGKISPPASGPAARAKTVVAKPSEAEPSAARVDPPVSNLSQKSAATAPAGPARSTGLGSLLSGVVPGSKSAPKTGALENGQANAEASPLPSTAVEQKDAVKNTAEKEIAAPQQHGSGPDSGINVAPAGKSSEENDAGSVVEQAAKVETDNRDMAMKAKAAAPAGSGTAAASQAATSGLGDRNPIEDEMAKILDELGGQPKQ